MLSASSFQPSSGNCKKPRLTLTLRECASERGRSEQNKSEKGRKESEEARAKSAQGGWDEKVMRGDVLSSILLFILLLQPSPIPCCVNASTCLVSSSTSLAFPSPPSPPPPPPPPPSPPVPALRLPLNFNFFSSTAGERRSETRRAEDVLEEGTLSSRAVA